MGTIDCETGIINSWSVPSKPMMKCKARHNCTVTYGHSASKCVGMVNNFNKEQMQPRNKSNNRDEYKNKEGTETSLLEQKTETWSEEECNQRNIDYEKWAKELLLDTNDSDSKWDKLEDQSSRKDEKDTHGIIETVVNKCEEEELSWCNVSQREDNMTNNNDNFSIVSSPSHSRNYNAEEELKRMLGIEQSNQSLFAIYTNDQNQVVNNVNCDQEWETWLGDTGASCHVTFRDKDLFNEVAGTNDKIIVGDQRKCAVIKKGDLTLMHMDEGTGITLGDVCVVQEIGKNIMSIGTLLKDGGQLKGNDNKLVVTYKGNVITFFRCRSDGLFYATLKQVTSNETLYCNMINDNNNEVWEVVGKHNKVNKKQNWPKMNRNEAHQKWGHAHYDQMNIMANHYKIHLQGKLNTCAGCSLVKSRAKATTTTCKKKATKNGE